MARLTAVFCILLIQLSDIFADTSPAHMYAEAIYGRMKLVWAKLAEQRADDLSLGRVVVHCEITPDGHAENVKITSNTGNRALGELAIATIRETHLPPVPPAVLRKLPRQRFTEDFEFSVVR